MTRYVAFLRAINVGGRNVRMEILRDLFTGLGFAEVETFIASGNVIFSAKSKDSAALERKIEAKLLQTLGYEVATFLRTDQEVIALAAAIPFSQEQRDQGQAFNIGFLAVPLDPSGCETLAGLKMEIDDFWTSGREVFWLCQMRQSDSKFSNVLFERKLRARITFRGAGMLARLAARLAA